MKKRKVLLLLTSGVLIRIDFIVKRSMERSGFTVKRRRKSREEVSISKKVSSEIGKGWDMLHTLHILYKS